MPQLRQNTSFGGRGRGRALTSGLAFARKVLRTEARAILALAGRLGPDYPKAVDILAACRGKICVTGMGKSGAVARKISGTLSSVGLPSFYLNPAEALHGDLGALSRGDVILALSHSGRTGELKAFLDAARRLRLPLIAMTGDGGSPLARMAAVRLDVGVKREADRLNLAPTASTAAALALGDALALSAASAKGYTAEAFAARHPGGALGERLSVPVGRLARPCGPRAWVGAGDSLSRVAARISAGGLGAVLVRGRAGRCAGIIVDGDLRRALSAPRGKAEPRAEGLMNRKPKTISEEAPASEALQMMEDKAVYQLVVLDRRGRVRGLAHIHDLLGRGQVRFAGA